MRNLKTILEELDITYTMPVQPVLLPKNVGRADGALRQYGFRQSRESLGNAGHYQDSVYKAPGMTL